MGTKSSIGGCHGGHAVAPRTQAPFARSIIYALGIQNLRWKGLNRAKSKRVSSEPLLWLDRGYAPAKDGTKTTEETPREVGEPARRTTPWPPPRGPGATQAGAGGCVRAPDVHMGPSGAWGVSGVLKLVYK